MRTCYYALRMLELYMTAAAATPAIHDPTPPAKPVRYAFLDSLRGLAAISVLYLHTADQLLQNNLVSPGGVEYFIMTTMTSVIDLGKVGVIIFFAVSGFIIPFALTKKNGSVTEFAVNRFFRLYPAYWLSIVLAVFVLYYLNGLPEPTGLILINLTMLQKFFLQPDLMDLYWTLQIELIFYALCVVAYLFGFLEDDKRLFLISMAMLIAALVLATVRYDTHIKTPVALPLALSIMLWGSMLKHFHIDGSPKAKRLSLLMLGAFAVLIPVICVLAYNFNAGFEETWYRYTASYFVGIAAFYMFTGIIRIVGPLWSWLGRISYSIYLFHPIFIVLTLMYVVPALPRSPIAHLYILAILIMTLAFCHITYAYIEAPCIATGHAVYKYFRSKRALACGIAVKP